MILTIEYILWVDSKHSIVNTRKTALTKPTHVGFRTTRFSVSYFLLVLYYYGLECQDFIFFYRRFWYIIMKTTVGHNDHNNLVFITVKICLVFNISIFTKHDVK